MTKLHLYTRSNVSNLPFYILTLMSQREDASQLSLLTRRLDEGELKIEISIQFDKLRICNLPTSLYWTSP